MRSNTTPRFKIKTCSTGQVSGFIVLFRRPVDGRTYPVHFLCGRAYLSMARKPATIFPTRRNAEAGIEQAKKTRLGGDDYTIQCVGNARMY